MRQKVSTGQLCFLAICIALSLGTKRVISPITNLLTDFIRIPGGGAATAFSLMFLVVATGAMPWPLATAAAGFVQSLLALSMGMSAYQGVFAVLTYTLPGVVIDLFRKCYPRRDKAYFSLSCGAANTAGALLTNLLVFHLEGIPFLLWMLVACSMGMLCGLLGEVLYRRLLQIPELGRIIKCQKN